MCVFLFITVKQRETILSVALNVDERFYDCTKVVIVCQIFKNEPN